VSQPGNVGLEDRLGCGNFLDIDAGTKPKLLQSFDQLPGAEVSWCSRSKWATA
jgi:hypothetical protein